MSNIQEDKNRLRKKISSIKNEYNKEELERRSQEVLDVLELTGVFQSAKTIFIYNSMEDEVKTSDFIRKWEKEKDFYTPVVKGDEIIFRQCNINTQLKESSFGIQEPIGENFSDYSKVDLIIVPGLAFDRKKNRMGRGKGYYDRFLPKLTAPKMGICFEFQLFDTIPSDKNDIKMDYIVSENEFIW